MESLFFFLSGIIRIREEKKKESVCVCMYTSSKKENIDNRLGQYICVYVCVYKGVTETKQN